MEKWMIGEENYAEDMDTQVMPYLKERKREMRLKSRDGKLLVVYNYHAEEPKQMVVISHGFTETAHKYAEAVYYFLIHGYEVYILDHCGHGKSYRLTEDSCKVYVDTYQRYIRDLLKVIAFAKREHPDLPLMLFGHSMGGGIAAVTAGRKPEWIDRLVLSSPMICPNTGKLPWWAVKTISNVACLLGKAESFVIGHGRYQGLESFESSASLSKARFNYYQAYKASEPEAQLSGATYGWMRAAAKIHEELMHFTYKKLDMPVLMFQAESDHCVRNDMQDAFLEKVKAEAGSDAVMVQIPNSKHEIMNAKDAAASNYWQEIFC